MHPSAALIAWLAAVLSLQWLADVSLLLAAVGLLLMPGMARSWWVYVRRARWLLASLWLILAYHTPGEAYADIAWAPTYEGVAEANRHALRLILMLGALSWLFVRLGRASLLAGLWGLLQPWRLLGLDGERLIVRLALVLDGLQQAPVKGAWRSMLLAEPDFTQGSSRLEFVSAVWTGRDTLRLSAILMLITGGVLL